MQRSTSWRGVAFGTQGLITLLITALTLTLAVSSAAAAPPDRFTGRTSYISVSGWTDGVYLHVDSSTQGTSGWIEFYDGSTYWSGSIYTSADALSVDRKLSSATLVPTTVWLYSYGNCSEEGECEVSSREVAVAATFEGAGDLLRSSARGRFEESDGCTYSFSDKGVRRAAGGSLTIGEQSVTLDGGYIVHATLSYRTQCS